MIKLHYNVAGKVCFSIANRFDVHLWVQPKYRVWGRSDMWQWPCSEFGLGPFLLVTW